jgi:hypothetical protein
MKYLWTLIHDLIFGRAVPVTPKATTVDIQRTKVSVPKRASATTRMLGGHHIIVLPFDNPQLMPSFTENNKHLVYHYVLKKMKRAIRNKMETLPLFQFGNTDKVAQLTKPGYEHHLKLMMEYFVKIEDYESATVCRDLIQQLHNTV